MESEPLPSYLRRGTFTSMTTGESPVKTSRGRLAVLAFLLMTSGGAVAQESVDARVQRLEETVRALQAQVASLEAQLLQKSAPVSAVPKGKEAWRKLKHGMSEADVEELLGSPKKVEATGTYIKWSYKNPDAYVLFATQPRELRAWSEPD